MENFWARQSLDATGSDNGSAMSSIGDPYDMPNAEYALGDEAAFPSTWQHLSGGEGSSD